MVTALLQRRKVVQQLLQDRGETLVISGLGSPSWDVFAAGDHPANFYLWGAMGGAAMAGLGLAQAQPQRPVLVITGDGEQLMGLGGLATIAAAAPGNLSIVVLDNERFGETGMQDSHTSGPTDLCKVALACGFEQAGQAEDMAAVNEITPHLHRIRNGPAFYVIKIAADTPPRALPPRDAVFLKNRFKDHLGLGLTANARR